MQFSLLSNTSVVRLKKKKQRSFFAKKQAELFNLNFSGAKQALM